MSNLVPTLEVQVLESTPHCAPIINGDLTMSGEDVVWSMMYKSTQITKMKPLDRSNYQISKPVQIDPNNPKLYEVTFTNLSDPLYKVGSTAKLRYFKHELNVLEHMRFRAGVEAVSLDDLIQMLSAMLRTKLTRDDFLVDECYEEDGYWYLKAADESWYFVSGTEVQFWNRSAWDGILEFLPEYDLGQFRVRSSDKVKTAKQIFDNNLSRFNSSKGLKKPIPFDKLEVVEYGFDEDDQPYFILDRIGSEKIIGPVTYNYKKVPVADFIISSRQTLSSFDYGPIIAAGPMASTYSVVDDDDYSIQLTYYWEQIGNGRQPAVGAVVRNGKDTFYAKSMWGNHAIGALEITTKVDVTYTFTVDCVQTYNAGNVHGIYIDGERVYTLLLGTTGLEFEVFSSGESGQIELWSEGELIARRSGNRVSIGALAPDARGNGVDTYIYDLIFHPPVNQEDYTFPELNNLEDGTIYSNLDKINSFFGINLTEDDVEDGEVLASPSFNFKLIAKENHLVLKGGSEFLIVRAPFMEHVFKVTDLRGFSPNPALVGHGTGITTRKFVYDDGIRTLNYYGALETDEFIQPAEVRRLTNVGGSVAYPETRWHKFELDGKYVYVPEKPIAGNVNANTLKARNLYFETEMRKEAGLPDTYRVNTLQYDGETYKVRILKTFPGTRLTAPDPTTDEMRMDFEPTHGSEWNRLYYPIAQTAVNYSHHNINKLDHKTSQVEPQWDELELQRDLAMVPNTTMSAYNVTQGEIASGNTYRGAYGVARLWTYAANSSTNVLGFRPILIHMPALKEHYKIKFSTFAKFETIEWDDYENIDLDYCKGLYLEHRPIDTDMEWTEEKVTMEQGKLLFILGRVHSGKELRIRHTDGNRTFYSTTLRTGWIQDHYEYVPGRFAGPGPQTLKRVAVGQVDEDLLIGYFGTVPSSEFLTTVQLKALLKSNLGGDGNITTWHKFLYGGRVCYIPQEYLHAGFYGYSLSSNNLRNGQIVNHEGHDYTVRAIKSTVSGEPLKFADIGGYDPVVTHGSEWNELVYRIVYGITGHNPFPDMDDRWNNVSESAFYSHSSGSYNAPLMYELSEEGPRVNLLARGGNGVAKIRYLNNNYGSASSLFSYKPIIYLGREPDYELIKDVQRANLRFVHDDMNETITLVNYLKVFSNYARTLKLIDEYGTVKDFSVPSTAFTSGDLVYYTGDWELKGRVKVLTNFGTRLLTIGWFTIGEGPNHIVTNPWVGEEKDGIRTPSYSLYNSGYYRVWDRIDKQDSADYSDILYLRHGGGRYTNGDRGTYASQQQVTVDSDGTMTVAEHTLVRYGSTSSLSANSPYAVQGICLETPVFESDDQAIIYTFDLPAVADTSVIRAVYSQAGMYATPGNISSLGLSLSSVGNRIVYHKNGTFEIYVGSRRVYVADISELRNNAIFIGYGTSAYLNRTTRYAISIANLRVRRLKAL